MTQETQKACLNVLSGGQGKLQRQLTLEGGRCQAETLGQGLSDIQAQAGGCRGQKGSGTEKGEARGSEGGAHRPRLAETRSKIPPKSRIRAWTFCGPSSPRVHPQKSWLLRGHERVKKIPQSELKLSPFCIL